MIFSNLKNSFVSAAAFLMLAGDATTAVADPVKNIVLVHGAWADGSGWKPVYEILSKDGYDVTMGQEPLTSREAGTDPHVVGLVYVAAHAPDVGEDEGALEKRMPSATQQQEGGEQDR